MSSLITILKDYSQIPSHLKPFDTLWAYNEITDIEGHLPVNKLSKQELQKVVKAGIVITGESSQYWEQNIPLLQSVESLVVQGRIPERILDKISHLPSIQKLRLDTVTSPSIAMIGELINLNDLSIFYTKPTVNLADLSSLKKLEVLCLALPSKLSKIDDFRIPNLRHLMIGSCADTKITKLETLKWILSFSKLEYLSLTNIQATDRSLRFLHSIENIKLFIQNSEDYWQV